MLFFYFSTDDFFYLSISLRVNDANIATKALKQKTINGRGSGASATIGAATVIKCATKFTIPKTHVTNLVGNKRATDTYPMLNDIDPPSLLNVTKVGITPGISVLYRIRYKTPAMSDDRYEKNKAFETVKYFRNIPERRKAHRSAQAKQSEFV